jgi:CBS domain-containing protein
MKVRELMTTPVTTVDPSDTVAFADELMRVERVRHLPVVDGDVLVGLLAQRDIFSASIPLMKDPSDEEDFEAKRKVAVREVMRGGLETVGPDDDAMGAADILLTQKIGCLPVVDERHHLIGIVTEADFVRWARHMLAQGKTPPRPAPGKKLKS